MQIKIGVLTRETPADALLKMAKFALVMQCWIEANDLVATAVQCWTSIEEYFGIVPCTVMSMLSNVLKPSACETDITGATATYPLALASGEPSALVDWNNNYGEHPDRGLVFHCSNFPKAFLYEPVMSYQDIIAEDVGKENTYGTVVGPVQSGPFTHCRISTDDEHGVIRAYLGGGVLTDDPIDTFGDQGVTHIPDLRSPPHHICKNGFKHHAALNGSRVADAVNQALGEHTGQDVYRYGSWGSGPVGKETWR